jgi:hypothetical protein
MNQSWCLLSGSAQIDALAQFIDLMGVDNLNLAEIGGDVVDPPRPFPGLALPLLLKETQGREDGVQLTLGQAQDDPVAHEDARVGDTAASSLTSQ